MDTSLIGQKSPPKSIVVEQGQLQLFAKATGTPDQIYWDVAAAKEAGHPALPAPPTFLMCLDSLAPSNDHRHISTAPVSDAGTTASR